MLDTATLKRRIDAARTLRGLTQNDLAALVHGDGFGKHDVGRLERGDIILSEGLQHSLSRHLRVPPTWFTDEDLIFDAPASGAMELQHPDAVIERLDRLLGRLIAHDEFSREVASVRGKQRPDLIAHRVVAMLEKHTEQLARIEATLTTLSAEALEQRLAEIAQRTQAQGGSSGKGRRAAGDRGEGG